VLDFLIRHSVLSGLILYAILNAAMIGMTFLGLRLGRRLHQEDCPPLGTGTIEAAVLGLFGLLAAFTFYGAADRFMDRRALILQESQAIGTAWSRLDLLPEPDRSDLKGRFRRYLDAKLAAYQRADDRETFLRRLEAVDEEGEGIVKASAASCRSEAGRPYAVAIMMEVNEMSDISLARHFAIWTHPPLTIYVLLIVLSLGSAFLISAVMSPAKKKSWIHLLAFCIVVSTTICVTIDLELPRLGLIRVDKADALLRNVRATMGP
jgi:hypothetical protein